MKTIPGRWIRSMLFVAFVVTGATISRAAELPTGGVASGAGVNIHFTRGHESDLDLIAAGGFKFVRMDFFWADTERNRGTYDWSAYDELTTNLEKRGLCAYYIFDYSSPLYEEVTVDKNSTQVLASPHHPESVAAFARWAAAAARHFHGHHVIWEIWNEPNGSFSEPQADAQAYTTLALATARAVRSADPQSTIFAPATSGFPWPFLKDFLQSGVLAYLDGVSVHPYRAPNQPPETASGDYGRLRGLIAANTPSSRHGVVPIISGEWGYSTCVNGVTPETQAAFCARQQLANSLSGVPISIWYDWKNDGDDPRENEHNFGTVRPDLTPKPAYAAIKTLTQQLAGFSIQNRYGLWDTNDFILVLTNAASATKLAAWTLREPHFLSLPIATSPSNVILMVNSGGLTRHIVAANSKIVLPLQATPLYVNLGRTPWP
ncbi:MAG: cellulase family glycosylhydrolase [Verrucomicrobiota bacterium]